MQCLQYVYYSLLFKQKHRECVKGHQRKPLRRNGTPPLFDVLLFEINNENYFLLIGFICTNFDNFPHSSVG